MVKADVAHTSRMIDMDSKTQGQVLGMPGQFYWLEMIFEDIDFACGAIRAPLVAPARTA